MDPDLTEPSPVMVTLAGYAAHKGVSQRTVERWLADDRLAGAEKRGKEWEIPLAAEPAPARSTSELARRHAPAAPPLVAIDVAAEVLGTTRRGVMMLNEAGILRVGKWGRHGALMVLGVDLMALRVPPA